MSNIGEQIAKRRKELGLSQDDLARKMGYTSRSTINKIESGVNDVPQRNIVKFAKALDTTVQYLMGMECNEEELAKIKEYNNTPNDIVVRLHEDNDFLLIVETLNNADKKRLKRYKAILDLLMQESEE